MFNYNIGSFISH